MRTTGRLSLVHDERKARDKREADHGQGMGAKRSIRAAVQYVENNLEARAHRRLHLVLNAIFQVKTVTCNQRLPDVPWLEPSERRLAIAVRQVHVGIHIHQQFDQVEMTGIRRQHQGGLAVGRTGIDTRAPGHQVTRDLDVAAEGRVMQWRPAIAVLLWATQFDQALDDRKVAASVASISAVSPYLLRIRWLARRLQQGRRPCQVAVARCRHQQRGSVRGRGVGIESELQQRHNDVDLVVFGAARMSS